MNQTTDTTSISDFILQEERNLRIAEAIYSTEWVRARNAVVKSFNGRLKAELSKKLTGWKFETDYLFFAEQWGAFQLWKPSWEAQYHIRLEAKNYGKEKMIYGIWRDDPIKSRQHSSELLEAVQKIHPSARSKNYCEAEIKLQSPAPDWRTAEVLWQMHTQDEFLQDVAAQLLELAKLSEPIVDKLVAKYGSNKEAKMLSTVSL